ncbi:hypothetical protein WI78_29270 [Burkholderia ubonensis]|uniref:hypothetical protein n=1 Tax=Burkholderia ubonensis TaxID=101571 RepID=UPI0007576978|nr:hypothetical protein WI78_29270 [Burkholderia ubonensis]
MAHDDARAAQPAGVVHADRMPYELRLIDPSRLPDLPAAQAPSLMEQLTGDDRNMVGLGWRFVATTGRSTPVTTHTDALGQNSFEKNAARACRSATRTRWRSRSRISSAKAGRPNSAGAFRPCSRCTGTAASGCRST